MDQDMKNLYDRLVPEMQERGVNIFKDLSPELQLALKEKVSEGIITNGGLKGIRAFLRAFTF